MKHTPGPWMLGEDVETCPAWPLVIFGPEDDKATRVTWVYCWEDDVPDAYVSDTALANARLIAAAPDLLAALQALDAIHDSCATLRGHGYDDLADAMGLARAAIAKATGEQP